MWRATVWTALAALALGGCTLRARPYRFAAPMLGRADVPWAALPDDRPPPTVDGPAATTGLAADEITREAAARGGVFSKLRAPHRGEEAVPALQRVEDLRGSVGRRDRRDPITVVLAWSRELGATIAPASDTGADVVAWADAKHRRGPATDVPAPGDLLVFDHATSEAPADLVAIAIGRDPRGVIEMVYVANGVVRRGFVDATRPRLHRDDASATVNTFLRHGRRWPPTGTRYLAGELLATVVHVQ